MMFCEQSGKAYVVLMSIPVKEGRDIMSQALYRILIFNVKIDTLLNADIIEPSTSLYENHE